MSRQYLRRALDFDAVTRMQERQGRGPRPAWTYRAARRNAVRDRRAAEIAAKRAAKA